MSESDHPAEPLSDLARRRERRRARREQRQKQQGDEGTQEAPVRSVSTRAAPARRAEGGAAEGNRPPRRGPEPRVFPVEFARESIDEPAARVVSRLTRSGFEAYLVGGCVRDLLVGKRPKDFDVATSARPEEVRALFRNSRIIGRRFRLVHVLFSAGHVVETATFRKNPTQDEQLEGEDLLIRSDNVFGQAFEDAGRRDFTINGLFYDLDRRAILDWVGGMEHIHARTVQTIGDPVVRFHEDPVRMLRAIKFAARLDFGISREVYDAAVQCRGMLAMAARPRLSEEVLRLMRGGASQRSVWLLWEMGMLDILLPELSAYLADCEDDTHVWALLSEVDRVVLDDGAALGDVLLWAALLVEPLLEACDQTSDPRRAARDFLEPIIERLNLPRRIAESVERIVAILPRIEAGRGQRQQKSALYPLALRLAGLRAIARGDTVRTTATRADAARGNGIPGGSPRAGASRQPIAAGPFDQEAEDLDVDVDVEVADGPVKKRRRRRTRPRS
jgi:poly(A) polymerase